MGTQVLLKDKINNKILGKTLIKLGLNQREVDRFTIALEDLGLAEFDEESDTFKIISPIYEGIINDDKIKNLLKDKFYRILEAFKEPTNKHSQIINSNKKEEKIKIKKNLAKEFKELWQTINKRAILTYNNINKDILLKEITKRFNNEKIEKEKIIGLLFQLLKDISQSLILTIERNPDIL